jgi:hypothetical protein
VNFQVKLIFNFFYYVNISVAQLLGIMQDIKNLVFFSFGIKLLYFSHLQVFFSIPSPGKRKAAYSKNKNGRHVATDYQGD